MSQQTVTIAQVLLYALPRRQLIINSFYILLVPGNFQEFMVNEMNC